MFTDVSDAFTGAARRKFSGYPFVRYQVLDIEHDPRAQGFADHTFDLILAANVLHATKDLRQSLRHVRQLLAPRGQLVLLEGSRPQRWLDLIFGLTDGWWRFADLELRPSHPLISARSWLDLLEQTDFTSAVALPEPHEETSSAVDPPHSVVVAQNGLAEDSPDRTPSAADQTAGRWMIFCDAGGVGEELAARLNGCGQECLLVYADGEFEQVDDHRVRINPSHPADFEQLLKTARDGQANGFRGVVHLWSLDAPQPEQLTAENLTAAQQLGCGSTIKTLQAFLQADHPALPRFWLVTRGAQAVGGDEALSGLAQSPLWGVGRVMSEEQPAFWGGLVDLDPGESVERLAEYLAAEVLAPDGEDQIAYRGDQRYAARLERRAVGATTPRPMRWRSDASYLVTGGVGDLGLEVARWMAQQGAERIILLGRSKFPPRETWSEMIEQDPRRKKQIEAVQVLESLGCQVMLAAADVGNESQLTDFLTQFEPSGWPPIRGVVHCAGIAEAAPLSDIDDDELFRVLQPKVVGTWLLDRLLGESRLDFFVNFSSGAALLGSPLLGSYAAANTFLDTLAHHRCAQGRAGLSINWG
ncbi:MAG: SDR family NAD(P)-dependent oxidoreductase, partial [Planctomycetota bacterium]